GDSANHILVEINVLEFDIAHLDTPRVGSLVQDALHLCVEFLAFRQHLIEVVLPKDRAQRSLCKLAGCGLELLDLDDCLLGIDHTEVDHGIDLDGDVVPRDHILRRHVEHARAQVHSHHLLDERHDNHETRTFYLPEATEQKHNGTLILAQDTY